MACFFFLISAMETLLSLIFLRTNFPLGIMDTNNYRTLINRFLNDKKEMSSVVVVALNKFVKKNNIPSVTVV